MATKNRDLWRDNIIALLKKSTHTRASLARELGIGYVGLCRYLKGEGTIYTRKATRILAKLHGARLPKDLPRDIIRRKLSDLKDGGVSLSGRELAARVGLNPNSVCGFLAGRRQITTAKATRILMYLEGLKGREQFRKDSAGAAHN